MPLADVLSDALLKVTDAMSESRTFPVNLLGPVVWQVGDWTIDKFDILESAIPIEVTTHKANTQRMRNAFELGLDAGRSEGKPRQPVAPVRHLHSV